MFRMSEWGESAVEHVSSTRGGDGRGRAALVFVVIDISIQQARNE